MIFIPPKPTVFRGINFRSQLEAQWALLLTLLRFDWTYEPWTISIGGWDYTPDFLIEHPKATLNPLLLEVKPKLPNDDYLSRLEPLNRTDVILQEGKKNHPATRFTFAVGYGSYFCGRVPRIYVSGNNCPADEFIAVNYHRRHKRVANEFRKVSNFRFDL